jgi:hypothetical protein
MCSPGLSIVLPCTTWNEKDFAWILSGGVLLACTRPHKDTLDTNHMIASKDKERRAKNDSTQAHTQRLLPLGHTVVLPITTRTVVKTKGEAARLALFRAPSECQEIANDLLRLWLKPLPSRALENYPSQTPLNYQTLVAYR